MNNGDTEITLEHDTTTLQAGYGRRYVEITYFMTHTCNGFQNKYHITCELRGVESGQVELHAGEVAFVGGRQGTRAQGQKFVNETNQETLTNEAAGDLFCGEIGQ